MRSDIIFVRNNFRIFSVRYALSCLSYTSPSQYVQYKNRLSIVDLLIEQYSNESLLSHGIIGNNNDEIHLFPLFDFLFYSLIQIRNDLENLTWNIFFNINLTKLLHSNIQIIFQNIFVYNYYYIHVIYLCQRLKIFDSFAFFLYYIERIAYDTKPNRFFLLLYLIYIDHGLIYVQTINDCFYMSLNTSRQYILRTFLNQYKKKPEKLKFYSRRLIRDKLFFGIHYKLEQLVLNNHLKNYILLTELNFLS